MLAPWAWQSLLMVPRTAMYTRVYTRVHTTVYTTAEAKADVSPRIKGGTTGNCQLTADHSKQLGPPFGDRL